jgi:hypothetical protein
VLSVIEKGAFNMKLKITERNGSLMVSVVGMRQELVISEEEGGGFALEILEKEDTPALDRLAARVACAEENPPAVLPVVEAEVDLFGKLAALRREIAANNNVPP